MTAKRDAKVDKKHRNLIMLVKNNPFEKWLKELNPNR